MNCMVDSKENYKFNLGVKGLTKIMSRKTKENGARSKEVKKIAHVCTVQIKITKLAYFQISWTQYF